jgi:alkanesulfonate monooxygenase SsuD/methylene tetrahydromethanopterin reductase-like flavin-dependent oxidoreductase (luciferase family)/predicted kinase
MTDSRRLADGSLVVLIGPSASGKSSWAAAHFEPDQIVASDRLRAVVGESERDQGASADAFAVLDAIVTARLRRRLTTVIDTTGLEPGNRDRWRRLAAQARMPCVAVCFDTPAAECRRRNAARSARVPPAVLTGQLRAYPAVRARLDGEGFDDVIAAGPVRVVPAAIAAAARARPATAPDPGEPPPADPVPGGRPRFGLQLSSFAMPGGAARWRDRLPEVAARVEAAGFDSIWVMDHLRQIPQVGRAWEDLPESVAVLGHLAAVTRTVTLGALVHNVTLRHPALLARSLATLDVLSGGRIWCGLGAGWFEAEQAALGMPFPPAAERLDLVEAYPRPLQPAIPILLGGQGERRTLRLAARHADACNLTGDAEAVRHKVAVLHRHCRDAGRDPAQVAVTHLSTALVAPDEAALVEAVARRRPGRGAARWTAWANPGTVEDHVLRVRSLLAAGVTHVIVSLDGVWDSAAIECYGEVIAQVRALG